MHTQKIITICGFYNNRLRLILQQDNQIAIIQYLSYSYMYVVDNDNVKVGLEG